MSDKKICELQIATTLPSPDQIVLPVFMDHTDNVVKSIPVETIISLIRDRVAQGGHVEIVQKPNGIVFMASDLPYEAYKLEDPPAD